MRESRLSGSVEGVLRNPDPYSDPVGIEANDQTYLKRAPFYNAFLGTYPFGDIFQGWYYAASEGIRRIQRQVLQSKSSKPFSH